MQIRISISTLMILIIFLLSCNKWDKEEKIPSYIGIYGAKLITDAATQGLLLLTIFLMYG